MIDELVSAALADMASLDEVAPDWRTELLRKALYEVAPDQRPVPDGLSRAYLVLAAEEGAADRAAGAAARARRTSALLTWIEGLVQAEIARAVVLEHDLLRQAVSDEAERQTVIRSL